MDYGALIARIIVGVAATVVVSCALGATIAVVWIWFGRWDSRRE